MADNSIASVGVVGAGLVGLGWAIVFSRAGLQVTIYDASGEARAAALGRLEASLNDMEAAGLLDNATDIMGRIRVVDTLAEAVGDADYVQESVFERVEVKSEIANAIGPLLKRGAMVGSSSSGIPASAFTEHAQNRHRFLIVHPVNPPQLIPLVELVPAPWTDQAIVPAVRSFMRQVGQVPIVVNREVEGFILNRLQGALLNEAWALFEEGYASVEDIDLTVSHGLGFRWSFMGPFETIDLNAPGGVADYARRLGPLYHGIALARSNPKPWSEELVSRVNSERRRELALDRLPERSAWRDRRLMAILRHKNAESDG